jgi:ABC-type transport system involved in multi-copper enzyme maturation permease subunit
VLLNSHLIGEVERVCDRVVVLDRGTVAASGTLAELLGRRELRMRLDGVTVAAQERLTASGELTRTGDAYTVVLPTEPDPATVPDLVADLVRLGVRVHSVEPARISLSLVAALGTAFLAGTLAGEVESGQALAVLARPVRRSAVLVGKWLGLVAFGSGFVALAGLAQFVVVRVTVGYWPPEPVTGLALLAAQTVVLLTLGLLLATAISPMASGIVAVGLFGATWIAGVVGGLGEALGNEDVTRVGGVSRMLLPTDGLWRGAMHAFQDPIALSQFGGPAVEGGMPFLSGGGLTLAYLAWTAVWVALVLGLAGMVFERRDL